MAGKQDRLANSAGRWKQRAVAAAALVVGYPPLGCGGTTTSASPEVPEECVGAYTGSYSGDVSGNIKGKLSDDARFSITFVQRGSEQGVTGTGSLDDDGEIGLQLGPNSVTGTFNFNRCRATGRWASGASEGNWTVTKQ